MALTEGLPRGWTGHVCKKTGKQYYHNAALGQTTWIRPLDTNGGTQDVGSTHGGSNGDQVSSNSSTRKADQGMPEADFENLLETVRRRKLSGSQARRLATIVQQQHPSLHISVSNGSRDRSRPRNGSTEEGGLQRADSLSDLKLSMGSREGTQPSRHEGGKELRTQSASEFESALGMSGSRRPSRDQLVNGTGGTSTAPGAFNKENQRGGMDANEGAQPRRRARPGRAQARRPEWNNDFTTQDDHQNAEDAGFESHEGQDAAHNHASKQHHHHQTKSDKTASDRVAELEAELQAFDNQRSAETHQRSEDRRKSSSQHRKPQDESLPEGWTSHTDAKSGKTYYHNKALARTTWHKPKKEAESSAASSSSTSAASPTAHHHHHRGQNRDGYDDHRSASSSRRDHHHHDSGPSSRGGGQGGYGQDDAGRPASSSRRASPPGSSTSRRRFRGGYEDDEDDEGYNERASTSERDKASSSASSSRGGGANYASKPSVMTGGGGPSSSVGTEAAGLPPEALQVGEMEPCCTCDRQVALKVLDRNEKAHGLRCCPKCAPKKQRKQFNSAALRAKGLEGEDRTLFKKGVLEVKKEQRQKAKGDPAPAQAEKPKKWQAQSNALRDAMRAMREDKDAQKAGLPLPVREPTQSAPDPSLVQCPHCERRFNQSAAERHIPKCGDIKAKPKRLVRGEGTQLGASSRRIQGNTTNLRR